MFNYLVQTLITFFDFIQFIFCSTKVRLGSNKILNFFRQFLIDVVVIIVNRGYLNKL